MVVYSAWNGLNWLLSLAALFVVADGEDTFGAMRAAVDFCRTRFGPICAVGTWFGLAHLGVFTIATFLAFLALGLIGLLPLAITFMGVLFVTLLYFAVADFLYVGRLAAYVATLELPAVPVAEALPSIPPRSPIDQSELILSDLQIVGT
jgi:hypothetical protein